MLSLEKRLALFKSELDKTSPEALHAELQSYDPVGPLADGFLCIEDTPSSLEQ